MSDDRPEDDVAVAESDDVKSKIAQLSGTRLQKKRKSKARSAQARVSETNLTPAKPAPAPHAGLTAMSAPVPKKPPPVGEVPVAAAPPTPATTAAVKTAPQKKAKEARGPRRGQAVAAFIAGLLAGSMPAIVEVGQQIADRGALPASVPVDAIARVYDLVHCKDGAKRWTCTLYGWDGQTYGTGEFVGSADATTQNWRELASQGQLMHDGWYQQGTMGENVLYVGGIAVDVGRPGKRK